MDRRYQALNYLDSQFSSMTKAKLATLFIGTKLGIPGARKRLHRKLIDTGAEVASTVGTKLLDDKLGKNRSKALATVEGGRDILSSFGTPKLGKIIIK